MSIKSSLRGLAALAIAAVSGLAAPVTAQQGAKASVDLELLLAVDISQSMDFDDHTVQREGYVEAFRHRDVINAMLSGPRGRIAVMYMEWAGDFDPIHTIPWTIIDSEKAAHDFADRLANEPVFGEQRTSISTATWAARASSSGSIGASASAPAASAAGPAGAGASAGARERLPPTRVPLEDWRSTATQPGPSGRGFT